METIARRVPLLRVTLIITVMIVAASLGKLASANAFAKAEAERTGRLLGEEATVESVDDGSFHLYFPVIKSPEVRRARRAMDWMSPRRKSKTPARVLLG